MALGFASALSTAGFEVAHGVVTIGYDDAAVDAGLARTEASTRAGAGRMSKLMLGFGAATALALGEGAKAATEFQTKMALIQSSAGGTAKDVQVLSKAVLDLAKTSPYGPNQLADAMFHLKSLGLDNAKAMDVLRASVKGAIAGQADLESVTNALGGAVRTNIKGAQDYTNAMAVMNATTGAGNMRMQDLVDSFGTGVLPVAKLAGLSITDVGASLALMTDENVPAVAAMTRFKTALMMMQAPSAKAEKAMERLGLSGHMLGDAIRGPQGWLGAVGLIARAYDRIAAAKGKTTAFADLAEAFGGARGASTIMMLANNIGVLSQKYDQIHKNAGNFNKDVAAQSKTASMQIKTAWSSVQVALVALGNVVLPILVTIARWFGDLADLAMRYSTVVKVLTGVIAAAIAVWVGWKVALLANAVAQKAVWLWTNRNASALDMLKTRMATGTATTEANTVALEANEAATVTWVETSDGALIAQTDQTAALGAQTEALIANTAAKEANAAASTTMAGASRFSLGALGGAGMFAAGGLIAGQVAGSLGAPQPVNRALTGAGIGAGIGMFFPELGGPITGAAVGGLVGAVSSLIHSGPSFDAQMTGMAVSVRQFGAAANTAKGNITQLHGQIATLRLNRDQLQRQVASDRAAARANPGSKVAADQLSADLAQIASIDQQIAAANSQINAQDQVRAKALAQQRDQIEQVAGKMQDLANVQTVYTRAGPMLRMGDQWVRIGNGEGEAKSKLDAYVQRLLQMADDAEKSSPKLAAVYDRLADIAKALHHIPTKKQITIAVNAVLSADAKKVIDVLSSEAHGALSPQRVAAANAAAARARAAGTHKATVAPLTTEQQIQVALANNPNNRAAIEAQIKHDKAELAWLKKRRDEGKLDNAKYVQMVQQVDADLQSMQQRLASLRKHKKKAGGISGAGTIQLPLSLQLAEAKAAATPGTRDDQRVAQAEIRWLNAEIKKVKSSHMSAKKKKEELIALYNMLAQEENKVAKAEKASDTAVIDALTLRNTWLGQFASNIYHSTPKGLEFGATQTGLPDWIKKSRETHHHHKTVHVEQHNHRPPRDQFETMRSARYAAQVVM